jgi:hypothetical protein
MQSNEDIYVIVKHWLTQNCPRQYRAGDGLLSEVAIYINEHIESHGGVWSFATLDAALADFVREQSRPGNWDNLVREVSEETDAQDCVFLWECGIRVDPEVIHCKQRTYF